MVTPPLDPPRRRWKRNAALLVAAMAATFIGVILDLYRIGTARDFSAPAIHGSLASARQATAPGPLRVSTENPRYFADGSSRPILLAGSHTWADLVDNGFGDPPPVFDYPRYLDFLVRENHNLIRLWAWEQTRWAPWVATADYFYAPAPYLRRGPGNALDGKPKFDLDRFDPDYFGRLRSRVEQADARGIYAVVMLFNGWSINPRVELGNAWLGHPFNAANNINQVDGDPSGRNDGFDVHRLSVDRVTAYQDAYVRKVIDTLDDLDNVLYEISNESDDGSWAWQLHMVDLIHAYEATLPKQHPVGTTPSEKPHSNAQMLDSRLEWYAPRPDLPDEDYKTDPPPATGRKVILSDTDHIFGIGGSRAWAWKNFLRGANLLFMDSYDGSAVGSGAPAAWDVYPETWLAILKKGLREILGMSHRLEGWQPDAPVWTSLRDNIGYIRRYSERLDLAQVVPRGELSSTRYCLGSRASAHSKEYLIYREEPRVPITVDLAEVSGDVAIEWFDPSTGATQPGGTARAGGPTTFESPFAGDVVLYLREVHSAM
jgi:uncharacterized protein DUF6298/collagenase-like protein with putative collagen-binding domain